MSDVVSSTAGELEVHVVQPDAGPRPPLLVVFNHGYGASGEDLVPFVPELLERESRLRSVRFAFPAAPLSMGDAGWGDARAWWPLDWVKLSTLSRTPAGREQLRNEVPEGLGSARRKLQGAIEALLAGTGLGPERVVLGGFSQGAMLATDLALHWEQRPAALVAWAEKKLCRAGASSAHSARDSRPDAGGRARPARCAGRCRHPSSVCPSPLAAARASCPTRSSVFLSAASLCRSP